MTTQSSGPNPAKDKSNKTIIDVILEGGGLTLDILQQVAGSTGIPYVSQAASILLKLFEIIQVKRLSRPRLGRVTVLFQGSHRSIVCQAVKDNKSGFNALANEATNVFSVLLQSYDKSRKGASSWPPSG